MIKIKYLIVLGALLASGCANEVVQDTIFLQNAKINAPVTQMPVFLSASDTLNVIVIRPRMFIGKNNKYYGRLSGHSRVNINGEFQISMNSGVKIMSLAPRIQTLVLMLISFSLMYSY
jgi:hypothetical protein